MTGDLLANRKHLTRFWGLFVYAKNAINAILRLTLRHVLMESLELKFLCENITFVLNNNYNYHNFAQRLIGPKYAHWKSGAFSLDMSISSRYLNRYNAFRAHKLSPSKYIKGISKREHVTHHLGLIYLPAKYPNRYNIQLLTNEALDIIQLLTSMR